MNKIALESVGSTSAMTSDFLVTCWEEFETL